MAHYDEHAPPHAPYPSYGEPLTGSTGHLYADSSYDDHDLAMPRPDFANLERANTPSTRGPGTPVQPYRDDPTSARNSQLPLHDDYDAQPAPYFGSPAVPYRPLGEKQAPYLAEHSRTTRRRTWPWLALAAILVVIIAVIVPLYFFVIRKHSSSSSSSTTSSGSSSSGASPTGGGSSTGNPGGSRLVVGHDGDTVTTADGGSFTYRNPHGGYFIVDPDNQFNDGARAQSWTPALNESWTWGTDYVHGVNLGGWLVLEPFISPSFFQKYADVVPRPVDEWTLSLAMAADTGPGGGLQQLEQHYSTFITEEDFAQIAGAGLNFVRLPMPYWAIEVWPGEPFLAKNAWNYVLKAFEWSRKYGLRMNLDVHTVPGAANEWNHSGRGGQIGFMNSTMGYANAQRHLNYVRYLAEFISQPQYKNVVTMFGVVNEPHADLPALKSFYLEAYNTVRAIGGMGEGNGPYISIHDNFKGLDSWTGYLAGSDRIALEQHQYFTFGGFGNQPDIAPFIQKPCSSWGGGINASQTAFGVTTAGEWSNGFNDCGLYINGLNDEHQTTNCPDWDDWANYTPDRKAQLQQFALTSMDALQNWFFWTWKIGNDSASGTVKAPLWSYQLGIQNGWMPTDPRAAVGACSFPPTDPITYSAWQTGGAGAGTIGADQLAQFAWPPTSMPGPGVPATDLPAYTPTGAIMTLPTVTGAAATAASGWFDAGDTAGAYTTAVGCDYPDAWRPAVASAPPCPGAAAGTVRRGVEVREPEVTPAPRD